MVSEEFFYNGSNQVSKNNMSVFKLMMCFRISCNCDRITTRFNFGIKLVSVYINDLPNACEFYLLKLRISFIVKTSKSCLWRLKIQKFAKKFSVRKNVLIIDKTQNLPFFLKKSQGEEIVLTDFTLVRINCVKYLGYLMDKQLNFNFHLAEVVKNCQNKFQLYHHRTIC